MKLCEPVDSYSQQQHAQILFSMVLLHQDVPRGQSLLVSVSGRIPLEHMKNKHVLQDERELSLAPDKEVKGGNYMYRYMYIVGTS